MINEIIGNVLYVKANNIVNGNMAQNDVSITFFVPKIFSSFALLAAMMLPF